MAVGPKKKKTPSGESGSFVARPDQVSSRPLTFFYPVGLRLPDLPEAPLPKHLDEAQLVAGELPAGGGGGGGVEQLLRRRRSDY